MSKFEATVNTINLHIHGIDVHNYIGFGDLSRGITIDKVMQIITTEFKSKYPRNEMCTDEVLMKAPIACISHNW